MEDVGDEFVEWGGGGGADVGGVGSGGELGCREAFETEVGAEC